MQTTFHDQGDLFTIDDANNLVFKATPSFVDGGNNVYELTVGVSDNADPNAADAIQEKWRLKLRYRLLTMFNPNPDFNGTVELNYVVSDGNGGNQLATNTLTISPLNDAPERIAGNVSTLFLVEDAPLTSMGLEDVDYGVGGGSDEGIPVAHLHGKQRSGWYCWSHLHSRRRDNNERCWGICLVK